MSNSRERVLELESQANKKKAEIIEHQTRFSELLGEFSGILTELHDLDPKSPTPLNSTYEIARARLDYKLCQTPHWELLKGNCWGSNWVIEVRPLRRKAGIAIGNSRFA